MAVSTRRAVPATRLPVASSFMDTTRRRPGTRTMRPATVSTWGEMWGKR